MIREFCYRYLPTVGLAVRNLDRTTARSVLAMLGVVIGVVAIASLGMFGTALQISATENLGDIGSEVSVSPAGGAGDPGTGVGVGTGQGTISERQYREIGRIADGETVPVRQKRGTTVYQGERVPAQLTWLPDPGSRFEGASGTVPSSLRSGVLVGSRVAQQTEITVGDALTIDDRTFRVQAVLESEGFTSQLSPDNNVLLPPREFESSGYSTVVVDAGNATAANETAMAIREQMNHREEVVRVQGGNSQGSEQVTSFYDTINTFLLGIGGISLVVAGVSILNVMLMSTVERREEIGVMRAVGFRKRDVLKVMLSEAVLLGVVGGAVGIGFSLLVGLLLYSTMLGDPFVVFDPRNLGRLGQAFGFAIITSLVSGAYPAWKAANERPVEALRS